MKKLPPFLPGLSTQLQGRPRRRQLGILRARRDEALASSISDLGGLFHDILPADWLAEVAADLRKRLFPRVAVFWAWLSQVIEQNESCARALAGYVACDQRQHDIRGFYELRGHFKEGEVAIGDRAFCSYEMIALLKGGGVGSVMRLHQRRDARRDWKAGKRIDASSRLVVWRKPSERGKAGLSKEEWDSLPARMELRYVRVRAVGRDGRPRTIHIVTTMLDAERYPAGEIAMLYMERWSIELKIRDIKTTLKFETMRVRTPAMARRTLKMVQIAYNLLKARQTEAVRGEPILVGDLGFKGTLDLLAATRAGFAGLAGRPRLRAAALADFEGRLRERIVETRPGRQEPRAVKTRPKPYQYMTRPRREFTEIPHRSHYRKAA